MKLKHFKLEEFKCPCCNTVAMATELLEKIDKARDIAEIPMHINSGYRCLNHNREIGSKDTSSHPMGEAVDIRVDNEDNQNRYKLITALLEAGFNRIGVAKDFIHADIATNKRQEIIWTY